jgi:uncharacterized protein YacL
VVETRGGQFLVEMARLAVVVLLVAAGYAVGPAVADRLTGIAPDTARLLTSLVGALLGYLLGGFGGRRLVIGVDQAQARLRSIDASVLISGLIGATLAAVAALVLASPLLLLPNRVVTVPVALLVVMIAGYVGGQIGTSRGGDLKRFVGVRGGFEVSSPSRGPGVKVVDSSALVDGRLVDVARAGFLEGTLVVPGFVLAELQGLADASDLARRTAGRRGLDVVRALQQEHLVVVEVTDEDVPGVAEVDGKLAALTRSRGGALVTTDSGLRRVAEISGLRVLDLSVLADAVKPPASPGDRIEVLVTKVGREPGQGVGYLADGSMVVVERSEDRVGATVEVEVTSVSQSTRGRMLFGVLAVERAGD